MGGYLTSTIGWRIQFWILAAFWLAVLLLVIFACPETTFIRSEVYETDLGARNGSTTASGQDGDLDPHKVRDSEAGEQSGILNTDDDPPKSYAKELLPFTRLQSGTNLFDAFVSYFITGLYPIVWYTFIVRIHDFPCSTRCITRELFVDHEVDIRHLSRMVRRRQHHTCSDLRQSPYSLYADADRLPKHFRISRSVSCRDYAASPCRSHLQVAC